MAVLGLNCCTGLSLAVMTGGYSDRSVQVSCCRAWTRGLPGCRAEAHGLRRCGSRAHLRLCLWALPGSGIESAFTALGGGFFTTEPPGKPYFSLDKNHGKQSKDLGRSGPCPSLTGCWKQFGDHPGLGNGVHCDALFTLHTLRPCCQHRQIVLSSYGF